VRLLGVRVAGLTSSASAAPGPGGPEPARRTGGLSKGRDGFAFSEDAVEDAVEGAAGGIVVAPGSHGALDQLSLRV
jgi:hypothetical protein